MSDSSILRAVLQLFRLLSLSDKRRLAKMVGFALLSSGLELCTAASLIVLAQALSRPEVSVQHVHRFISNTLTPVESIVLIALLTGVVFFIKNSIAALEAFYQNLSIQHINFKMKDKLLQRYAHREYSDYLTRNASYDASVVSSDTDIVFSMGLLALVGIFSESIIFVVLIGMMVYINPSIALVLFSAGGVLFFLFQRLILPRFYHWGKAVQQTGIASHQHLYQFFHAYKEIVLSGKRSAFIDVYKTYAEQRAHIFAIQSASNILPRLLIETAFMGVFVATVIYMCCKAASPEQIVGILGGYLYAGFRLMPGLNRIVTQLNVFKSSIPSIERLDQEVHLYNQPVPDLDVPEFTFNESIVIEHADFRYPNTDRDILSNVNLRILKGECVGIIGETGSGKSTLVDMILGLLRPYRGSACIDGRYPAQAMQWQQKCGYVPQSIYLMDDTIEANIAFGFKPEEVDSKRLMKAIERAELSRFIEQLPHGVKTMVGDRGICLSGGERQRIAIARALYREPQVLIFDEATSALDSDTEARLIKTILNLKHQYTIIMIAHRTSTLSECDRLFEVSQGMVKSH